MVFVLKRTLWVLFLGLFPRAKTTYKLLRSTKNVANITKALNVRENLKQKTYLVLIGKFFSVVKMTLCDICEGWVKSWFWMDYTTPQPPAFLDQPPLCITHPWILKFFQNSHNSVFWTLHTPPSPPISKWGKRKGKVQTMRLQLENHYHVVFDNLRTLHTLCHGQDPQKI